MALDIALFFFISHNVQLVISQTGTFASFGEKVGDTVISNDTPNFSGSQRSISWNLTKPFKAFGDDQMLIKVR